MQSDSIPSVFLVDDSEAVRDRLKELFAVGARVRIVGEADTVARAIVDIGASQPDFVVLDYQLPDGTGLDVLREVRRLAPASCFIVLTNHPSPELHDAFVNAGAQFFLDKSFEFGRLGRLIAELQATDRQDTTDVLLGR
jgi:DNA-binding NarL/FixJ family response regulator